MAGEKPTSRRDFLRGRAAARMLVDQVQRLADVAAAAMPGAQAEHPVATSDARRLPAAPRLCATRRAMACEFAIEYHAADGSHAAEAVLAALDAIDGIESQLTVYREQSEVVDLNRLAAERATPVESRLFSLLELCAWLHAETGGAFDPTSGPLSRTWGFFRREGRLPADAEIAAALAAVGFQHVSLDGPRHTVQFMKQNMELNFNAVGKGYALDRVAQLLAERGVDDYLCHGGSSSVLARGRDQSRAAGGWSIAIPHPHQLDQTIGEVVLRDEALGTSGAGTQFFEAGPRRFGHLIDPRTGWPAAGMHTATAVAATAAEADALSTAFYILGPAGTSEFCALHADVGAVLVCPRDDGPAFDVHAFNLDASRWQPG